MKKGRSIIIIVVMFAVFFISMLSTHATLELRGTDSLGNRLIYDSDLNITWYDYTKSSDYWQGQMNWASALSVSGGDLVGVYDDWRLPTALNQDGTGPCYVWNCTGSEMGHLYYTELGNVVSELGHGLTKTGDFQKLQPTGYWSSTEYAANTIKAWLLYTNHGGQGTDSKNQYLSAIAVRDGDVTSAVVDVDGDGVDNETDNCIYVANASQSDADDDLVGDACDTDIDGDGVLNDSDLCEFTDNGSVVHPSNGCSIEQLNPCQGPKGTAVSWKNHGTYISSVATTANSFLAQGLITEEEKGSIVSSAANSTCGQK